MARWGYPWLNRGRWRDEQVVDPWFVDRSLRPIKGPGGEFAHINEGWQIHLNTDGTAWPGLPGDSYAASGAEAQGVIFISPSHKIVIARNGKPPAQKDNIAEFLKPLLDAVTTE